MNSTNPESVLAPLRWRYAVKKFDAAKKIPDATWQALEEALRLAPSSYGLQPWKFTVVTDPATRAELHKVSWKQSQIIDASHLVVFSSRTTMTPTDVDRLIQQMVRQRGGDASGLEGYKKIILGSISQQTPENLGVWNSRQTYIALGVFLTAAAMLGVDACPMEGISGPEYDKILGLSAQGYTTHCVATAGYRAADDKYAEAAKVRYDVNDVIAHV